MFKTGYLKAKIQVLESILTELPQQTQKIRLTYKFQDEEKLNQFIQLEKERKQQQAEYEDIQNSSQDQMEQNEDKINVKNQSLPIPKKPTAKLHENKIQVNSESSVIYKTYFQKDFDRIAQKYNVNISTRIQKIIFSGYDIEDIEDALDEIKQLINHIEVEYIDRFGLEITQSQQLTRLCNDAGIKIFKLIDKYYRWYFIDMNLSSEEEKKQRHKIDEVIKKINSTHHCIQYLNLIDEEVDWEKGSQKNDSFKLREHLMPYRCLLETLKCEIFESELELKMNKSLSDEEKQIELSKSRQALVFHSDCKEYIEINMKEAKIQYQSFDYFFITVPSYYDIQGAIKLFDEYKYDLSKQSQRNFNNRNKNVNEKNISSYVHYVNNYERMKKKYVNEWNEGEGNDFSVLFCIGFRKNQYEKMEFLCKLVTQLFQLWKGANFQLSIRICEKLIELEDQRISFEADSANKMFHMNVNESKLDVYLFIMRDYVIRKKLGNSKVQLRDQSFSIDTINTSIVNDTTQLKERTLSEANNTSIFEEKSNKIYSNQLGRGDDVLNGLNQSADKAKFTEILRQYKVLFEQTSKEYNNKYDEKNQSQKVQQNIIVKKDKRSKPLQEQIQKLIKSKYYVYNVKLNARHKVEHFYSENKNNLVSVFVLEGVSPFVKLEKINEKHSEEFNNSFPVSLFLKNQTMNENGYLINVKKSDIFFEGRTYRVGYGREFEVAKVLENLKFNKKK